MKRLAALIVLAVCATPGQAQSTGYERAFEQERRGNPAAAAEAYREALRAVPGDVNAVLGLERVLEELGRWGEMGPAASAALAMDPGNPVLLGVAVRSWMAAGQVDSVRRLVRAWGVVDPGSEAPFREWGFAALARRDRPAAREAYMAGRLQLGRPDAMAGELAQLATIEGDYLTATAEWRRAVRGIPGYRASALGMLSQVAPDRRREVLAALSQENDPVGHSLAAGLQVRWGDPVSGFDRLARSLPDGDAGTVFLTEFLQELRPLGSPEAALARGRCLEALADREDAAAARYLAEAARAYSEAGDQASARRMLSLLAADPSSTPAVAAEAGATLVAVLIGEGQFDEADRQLASVGGAISVEERDRLRLSLARGLLRAGRLERVELLLGADSTVEAMAVRGRLALMRGQLGAAMEALAAAGPYAIGREDATERAGLLALLQVIDADSMPALGLAFTRLERGDSAGAREGFEAAGALLPPTRGGAATLLLAGRIAAGQGAAAEAERLLLAAASVPEAAAATQARLELARLLLDGGRIDHATAVLEQLILDQPTSAVAPQARRLLDVAQGKVPPG